MKLYSLKQIAEALGVSYQAADKRSKNGRKNRKGEQTEAPWVAAGKNGKAALFAFDSLPEDVQMALSCAECRALNKMLKRLNKAVRSLENAFRGRP